MISKFLVLNANYNDEKYNRIQIESKTDGTHFNNQPRITEF
jgi:hypothetical protein